MVKSGAVWGAVWEIANWDNEIRNRASMEERNFMAVNIAEVGKLVTEERRQKTKDGSQETEDRSQPRHRFQRIVSCDSAGNGQFLLLTFNYQLTNLRNYQILLTPVS